MCSNNWLSRLLQFGDWKKLNYFGVLRCVWLFWFGITVICSSDYSDDYSCRWLWKLLLILLTSCGILAVWLFELRLSRTSISVQLFSPFYSTLWLFFDLYTITLKFTCWSYSSPPCWSLFYSPNCWFIRLSLLSTIFTSSYITPFIFYNYSWWK